ncbi:MAG TPA: hypothetical protein VK658_10220 [Chryseolinea sp.]|nr:hypothetical protein [Chryseolinea sp.]
MKKSVKIRFVELNVIITTDKYLYPATGMAPMVFHHVVPIARQLPS